MTTSATSLNTLDTSSASGASNAHELFALTDEQILAIEPDTAGVETAASPQSQSAEATEASSGESSSQAATGPFSAPDDVRSLAELYPGGLAQAKTAAERASVLDEFDAAFYGEVGKSAEEISAGRAALAQRMLHEDPAAFREMVFAGLRALEDAAQSPQNSQSTGQNVALRFSGASSREAAAAPDARLKPAGAGTLETQAASRESTASDPQLAAYRSFEKSANEDLERSVGAAIQRSLEQALPNLGKQSDVTTAGARQAVPLQQKLAAAVREDVEAALKSDQQLGEQLARLLSARRFDEATRAQVVRLINDRAQQLVPVAARRVIQEWTQTAFAAHREKGFNVPSGLPAQAGFGPASGEDSVLTGNRANPVAQRSLTLSSTQSRAASPRASAPAVSVKAAAADRAERDAGLRARATARPNGRPVDYSRLTDEQILDL